MGTSVVAAAEVDGDCAPVLGRHTKEQFRLLGVRSMLETPNGGKNGRGWEGAGFTHSQQMDQSGPFEAPWRYREGQGCPFKD